MQITKKSSNVDKDYVKNILIKYLEYLASGEEKEAMTLEKVLFTVLSATTNDLSGLQKVRQKNNTGLLSYFYTPAHLQVAKPVKVRMQIQKKQTEQVEETNPNDMSMEFE